MVPKHYKEPPLNTELVTLKAKGDLVPQDSILGWPEKPSMSGCGGARAGMMHVGTH